MTSVLMPETHHFGDLILAVQDFSRPSTWIWDNVGFKLANSKNAPSLQNDLG